MSSRQSIAAWPTTSAGATALKFGAQVGAGSELVGFSIWNDITDACTYTDDDLNAWAAQGGPQNGATLLAAFRAQLFAVGNALNGLSTTVTATFTVNAVTRRGVGLLEVDQIHKDNPISVAAQYVQRNGTALASPTINIQPDDFVIAGCLTSGQIGSVNAPFVMRELANLGGNALATYGPVGGAGVQAVTATFNDIAGGAQDAVVCIMALRRDMARRLMLRHRRQRRRARV